MLNVLLSDQVTPYRKLSLGLFILVYIVLVLRGSFVFFGWTVSALGCVGRGAACVISPVANRRAASCRDLSSAVITIFVIDVEAVLLVYSSAVEISTDIFVACVAALGSVG